MSIEPSDNNLKELLLKLLNAMVAAGDKVRLLIYPESKPIKQYGQDAQTVWKNFVGYKMEHPNDWRDSPQDKAIRTILGRILLVVYVLVFISGAGMVSVKNALMGRPPISRASFVQQAPGKLICQQPYNRCSANL